MGVALDLEGRCVKGLRGLARRGFEAWREAQINRREERRVRVVRPIRLLLSQRR